MKKLEPKRLEPKRLEIEKKDANQKKLLVLALGFLTLLACSFFVIFYFSKKLFNDERDRQGFVKYRYEPKVEEMNDFESGRPADELKNLQLQHLKRLNQTLDSFSHKSVAEIDGIFNASLKSGGRSK